MKRDESSESRVSSRDDDIAEMAQKGDKDSQEYILTRYKNLVKSIGQSYKIAGAEMEDIIQEGMIGLYKAIRDFDRSRGVYFHVFAKTCINRQIITAVRAANRKKHKPLNDYVSLDQKDKESDEIKEGFMTASEEYKNPETLFLIKEEAELLQKMLEKLLTKKESEIFQMYLKGSTYKDMAAFTGITEKGIGSTIHRIKRKLLTKGTNIY